MPSDPAVADRPTSPIVLGRPGPSWLTLRVEPESVAKARRFTKDVISGHVDDADHAYTIVLLVSELVTNAVRAAARLGPGVDEWPVHLGVHATDRWTHLYVVDPDPNLPQLRAAGDDDESGRGLHIVDAFAAVGWVRQRRHDKTMHVVIAAPGVTLTAADLGAIGVPR